MMCVTELAGEKIGVPPERCVVVEDSLVGLRAAKGAGMRCIITYTESTKDCDFYAEVSHVACVTSLSSLYAPGHAHVIPGRISQILRHKSIIPLFMSVCSTWECLQL
jgi:hypothetical protein